MTSRLRNGIKLLTSIAVPQAAGGIGTLFTETGMDRWYRTIEKPSFTPPSWVFGPVWITLYVLMGISAFLVWRKGWNRPGVKPALAVFGAQLAANTLWSYVFFGRHSIGGALAVIVVLWGLILLTMVEFFRLSRTAAFLLVPYFLWVSFAAVLNYSIYVLNR